MRVNYRNGSKERLIEMMGKVNNVSESVIENKRRESIIDEFVEFVNNHLQFGDSKPEITISYQDGEAAEMTSFGKYTPHDGKIRVVALNRNLADVLRTLAHEMVHFKQHSDGRLQPNSGDDGSEIENEANATAAVIMRQFGKSNPIIFE